MGLRDLARPFVPPAANPKARKVTPLADSQSRESEDAKAEKSARMKALNADPEFKAKTAARMKALHADPEYTKRLHDARRKKFRIARIAKLKAKLAEELAAED